MPPRTPAATGKPDKPAAKTSGVKTAAKQARAARSTVARPRAKKGSGIPADERQRLIAEAAYFKAERRGFAEGSDVDDWIEAEAEIDALLASRGAG